MQTAAAEPALTAGPIDEQLTARLLQQRIIVLGAEVDDRIANRLCAQLLLLSAEDPRGDISLYINSPGGSVSAGLAIYDTMRLIPNDVSTLAMGLAGSMGQFLLCAGAAGKRFSLPHAQVLMHQGSAGFGGTAADVEIYAEQLERTGKTMTRLIAKHTGQPVAEGRAGQPAGPLVQRRGGARLRDDRPHRGAGRRRPPRGRRAAAGL